jgi:hypothetical protein
MKHKPRYKALSTFVIGDGVTWARLIHKGDRFWRDKHLFTSVKKPEDISFTVYDTAWIHEHFAKVKK